MLPPFVLTSFTQAHLCDTVPHFATYRAAMARYPPNNKHQRVLRYSCYKYDAIRKYRCCASKRGCLGISRFFLPDAASFSVNVSAFCHVMFWCFSVAWSLQRRGLPLHPNSLPLVFFFFVSRNSDFDYRYRDHSLLSGVYILCITLFLCKFLVDKESCVPFYMTITVTVATSCFGGFYFYCRYRFGYRKKTPGI